MTIASILATKGDKVVTIRPEQSIRDALRVLAEHNIGALVAVDPRPRPVGISPSATSSARRCGTSGLRPTVEPVMTRDVIVGVPEDDLRAVRHTMTSGASGTSRWSRTAGSSASSRSATW